MEEHIRRIENRVWRVLSRHYGESVPPNIKKLVDGQISALKAVARSVHPKDRRFIEELLKSFKPSGAGPALPGMLMRLCRLVENADRLRGKRALRDMAIKSVKRNDGIALILLESAINTLPTEHLHTVDKYLRAFLKAQGKERVPKTHVQEYARVAGVVAAAVGRYGVDANTALVRYAKEHAGLDMDPGDVILGLKDYAGLVLLKEHLRMEQKTPFDRHLYDTLERIVGHILRGEENNMANIPLSDVPKWLRNIGGMRFLLGNGEYLVGPLHIAEVLRGLDRRLTCFHPLAVNGKHGVDRAIHPRRGSVVTLYVVVKDRNGKHRDLVSLVLDPTKGSAYIASRISRRVSVDHLLDVVEQFIHEANRHGADFSKIYVGSKDGEWHSIPAFLYDDYVVPTSERQSLFKGFLARKVARSKEEK